MNLPNFKTSPKQHVYTLEVFENQKKKKIPVIPPLMLPLLTLK